MFNYQTYPAPLPELRAKGRGTRTGGANTVNQSIWRFDPGTGEVHKSLSLFQRQCDTILLCFKSFKGEFYQNSDKSI